MDSTIKLIEHVNTFPCLMIHKICGDISNGIFLVDKPADKIGETFSVCRVAATNEGERIGEVWFKAELDPSEWFAMPVGTEVTITN